jgi:hypothetical protein
VQEARRIGALKKARDGYAWTEDSTDPVTVAFRTDGKAVLYSQHGRGVCRSA